MPDDYWWYKPVGDKLLALEFCIGHCHVAICDSAKALLWREERKYKRLEEARLRADQLEARNLMPPELVN